MAVKNNAAYFALKNGTKCLFYSINSNNAKLHSAYGVSTSCDSKCGSDMVWDGLKCGGLTSVSVFKLGVLMINVK